MGGLGAPSRCVVRDVAVGSTGGVASVGEDVPCELVWGRCGPAICMWMGRAVVRWI